MNTLIGQTGTFYFSNHQPLVGEITHKPTSTGDSWVIEEDGTGDVVFINTFDYMRVTKPDYG